MNNAAQNQMSAEGIAFLCEEEGLRLEAYQCPAGVWTIGVGHTSKSGFPPVSPGMRITKEQAFEILRQDLRRYEQRVEQALGPVPHDVFDAAVSFDFNTGAIDRASWVRLYRAGRLQEAEDSFLRWSHVGGRFVPGLLQRRKREARRLFHSECIPGKTPPSKVEALQMLDIQRILLQLGLYKGAVDGIEGPLTKTALHAFQRHNGLKEDGIAGTTTRYFLMRTALLREEKEIREQKLRLWKQRLPLGGAVLMTTFGSLVLSSFDSSPLFFSDSYWLWSLGLLGILIIGGVAGMFFLKNAPKNKRRSSS